MSARRRVELCDGWRVREVSASPRAASWITSNVPGCVQEDLIAAGLLNDVHDREGDRDYAWVSRTAWEYERQLALPEGLGDNDRVELVFECIDTLAEIWLDDELLGRCDNMFRPWAFQLSARWNGSRTLRVRFPSLFAHLDRKNAERRLPGWGVGQDKDDTGGWVRKAPVDFGWDFAPKVVPVGLRGPVSLDVWRGARIADVQVRQTHDELSVSLSARLGIECVDPHALTANFCLRHNGQVVAASTTPVEGHAAQIDVRIDEPELWWPNGLGPQPLYDVELQLIGRDAEVIDTFQSRIGLRRLELLREPDADGSGESFRLAANGQPFFAYGANWVPADALPSRAFAKIDAQLERAAAGGMNMIRVWGGGGYESDHFHDRCDELGLVVWQDFAFACCTYPSFDAEWMASVRAEAMHQVRRLRHHASLALWCGNNEVENNIAGPVWDDEHMSWKDYSKLFDDLLDDVVTEHDPDHSYWPGSPHTPLGDRADFNNPDSGDAHLWQSWHSGEPFEVHLECRHRFVSEIGWQAFPPIEALREFLTPEDESLDSAAVAHRQRSSVGNARLVEFLERYDYEWSTFEEFVVATQRLQEQFTTLVVEHFRGQWPRCGGVLLWQLNAPWCAPTWALARDDAVE